MRRSSSSGRLLLDRLCPCLLALALAAPTPADEVRLTDGRVLVGSVVVKDKTWQITTRDGVVMVPESDVRERILDDKLREELLLLARSAGESPFANLQIAMRAREKGLEPELWRFLDRAVELRHRGEASASVQRQLDDFLAQLEPEVLPNRYRTAATKVRVHQLLELVHGGATTGRLAVIDELLAREPAADQDLRTEARRNGNSRQRIAALRALQHRPLVGNDRFVLRTAVLDGSEQVRDAAIAIGKPTVGLDDLEYVAAGLAHPNAKVRVRSAEALGNLGKPEAAKWLVAAGPTAGAGLAGGEGSNGIRGYIAITTQTSYVRDFDVEVAQAAAVADPKVGVLQSGAVLDVTVAGVFEERVIVRAYRAALRQLVGGDPGEDTHKWAAWLANQKLPGAPAATPSAPATTPSAAPGPAPSAPKR